MAEDWSVDVRKYAPNADSSVIAAIVRYCGIALQNRDSSLVSYTDQEELTRVRENFLKKKLGLTNTDAELNEAIADVGERMKADRTKNRVTVYYLLTEHFRKLSLFGGTDTIARVEKPILAASAAAAGVAAAATVADIGDRPVAAVAPAFAARPAGAAAAARPGLMRWLPWRLLAAALALLLWFLMAQRQATPPVASPDVTAPAVAVAPAAPAVPAAPVVAAPPAAIVGLPANVHFNLGSSAITGEGGRAIAAAADAVKRDSLRVAITGYTDRTGNLPSNEVLARNRAAAVRDALVAAGVPAASIEMRRPPAVENGPAGVADLEARRVEISRL